MRIASYITSDGTASFGVAENGQLKDVGAAFRQKYSDLRAVLAAGALGDLAAAAGQGGALAEGDVTLISPVPNPDKIICIGLNYMTHINETGRDKPAKPSIFTRYPSSVTGHGQPMIRPKASDWFDFEGELAVIIGTAGRDIAEADAMQHVAGYSCFNDGSIRDYQRHTSQFWAGKNFVDSGAMGPWLVTTDELTDPAAQTMETRLNGEVMQSTPISDLAFNIPELIAYLSIVTELLPGDVIATGTPSGVGLFREPKLFMKDGDNVEVEISGIGTLSNPIRDQV
ncbi:fumarylacetoacetate hydrolase family protein [Sulfitobacter pseudonitzschiae]|uniref:Fumarylacetoacetate hydrolase family protein n=1 Tax=Pseudosulfitobacter pseudonitzschiae TaxID=1402135 RepID=A0A9Q2NYB7_9RHOB|nr:fumarylacetoacetate hydrolase family protein [Pseudosulfitobacter pseudonitzschiae]MBM2294826.1 fumarylacetoacetate hydrolase family protein [Pseudosulfitobacter pseudonitzschiae]MBM2299763.1 fumarylacetoacetate hydrolase family protein [Pseudosulfitobacter pseudonitzschiae]MBM2304663.1 fumarylacetoacetate hydrolase family protein [Pseudosulfitobacter pseudonitzschiae]MBM2314436.1 fumarylacetoacetate hydrolase family protein [Pseudosulfitobacter pseudonitzschiae]MBM2319332.1 fumarylacetoace